MIVYGLSHTVVSLALPTGAVAVLETYLPLSWLSDVFFWLFMAFLGLLYILMYVIMAVVAWLIMMGILALIAWPLGWLYEKLTEEPPRPQQANPYQQIDQLSHDYLDAAARLLQRR